MEQKDHEKDDGLLGSVLGGILGFFGIQSEEQKKAEIIQKGVELQEIQESIAILNTTILQLKNKEKELDEKGKLMRTQREEKQRKAYLKANQKRRILLKFIFWGILFAVGLTIPLFFFKIIIINNTSEWLFVLLIFSLVMLALMASLPKEKKIYLEPSNEEKNILQEHQEIFSNLLTQEKEIVVLQEVFLEKQENFLEKLELINPDIAEDLIQEVLGKVLKNIFARDQLSLIDLKYLKEKRLYLKEKPLQREQEIREEKLRKEREEKIKNQNSYKPSQNYSNSSWSWRNDNKEINVKGHYRKNGTYVKPYKRRKS